MDREQIQPRAGGRYRGDPPTIIGDVNGAVETDGRRGAGATAVCGVIPLHERIRLHGGQCAAARRVDGAVCADNRRSVVNRHPRLPLD